MQKRITPYPLRMLEATREAAQREAQRNRRSLNAELCLLIEEALEARSKRRPRA